MQIARSGRAIESVAAWKKLAPPKRADQWCEGRSAVELASIDRPSSFVGKVVTRHR